MINGTVWVNDRHEIIRDVEDLVQLVREHIGDEVAQMVQTLADLSDKAAHLADTDFAAYEAELESVRATLQEMMYTINTIRYELDKPKTSKKNVLKLLQKLDVEISNHI